MTRIVAGSDIVWKTSPNVPVVAVESAEVHSATPHELLPIKQVRAAVAMLPNADLDYEPWRDMVFSIHAATGGSEEGYEIARAWSAKSPKHDEKFFRERVWRYVRGEDERRGRSIGPELVLGAAARAGWEDPRVAEDFEVVPESGDQAAGEVAVGRVSTPATRKVPKAQHLCTDQRNAQRLQREFTGQMVVINGSWHAWVGTHWSKDAGAVAQKNMNLSRLVTAEARWWETKPLVETDNVKREAELAHNLDTAESLHKWSARCENKSQIDNALTLVERLMIVPPERVDSSPWLLNCNNGTVDLRSGLLKPHDPEDYITKLVDTPYDPTARSEVWENVLAQVTMEEKLGPTKPVAAFLKRWFGYCSTGDVREQRFVVHWGNGRNGKSTILDTVADVLGEYAGPAAPGMLMGGKDDRHPTEIADLLGVRMVTAHESDEGGVLREGFVKQATGGDSIKGRYMRQDFFKFKPTHKLQLLTNFKPQIKGQDEGIWRRVLLVSYTAKFGSSEEMSSGRATHLRDTAIIGRLTAERAGVLAWLVAGAVEWYRDGLLPPDTVLAASKDYQTEQDKVGNFVADECECDPEFKATLSDVYQTYHSWCRTAGYHALGRRRMQQELERCVVGYRSAEEKETRNGVRRSVVKIYGIKLANGSDL